MQNLHQQDLSREFLATLDQAALVELVLQFNFEYKTLDSKFQVLAKHARNAIAEKYGQKTERFEHPGQLLLFPSKLKAIQLKAQGQRLRSHLPGQVNLAILVIRSLIYRTFQSPRQRRISRIEMAQ